MCPFSHLSLEKKNIPISYHDTIQVYCVRFKCPVSLQPLRWKDKLNTLYG